MSVCVQKLRVPVRLSQPNHDPRDGWLLLFPQVGGEGRTESLIELLNSERTIIPFLPTDDASVVLLTRLNIDWVAVGSGVEWTLEFPPGGLPTREQRAELLFVDQRHLEVALQGRAVDEHVRLSDFLNSSGDFITAQTAFGTLIVNMHGVRDIRITQPAARAAVPGGSAHQVSASGPLSAQGSG
jgi:hypothetical protein